MISRGPALAFAVALAATPPVAAHAQESTPAVDIIRRGDQKSVEGPQAWFTGKVTITGQFQRPAPSRVGGAIVRFAPGARTAWHVHPLGQNLIITEGVGRTQVEGGPVLEFRAGDIVWCPPGRRHWHGASPDSAMTHIAIQEALSGSPVSWMEHVSDEQYLAVSASDQTAR